jgi:excisionase family DNA binding protein
MVNRVGIRYREAGAAVYSEGGERRCTVSVDLSSWYPQSEAAELLGVSEKTLERMVKKGTGPECQKRRRPGRKPENVYNPGDVDALVAAAGRTVFSASSRIGMPAAVATRQPDGIPPALAAVLGLFEKLAGMAVRSRQELAAPAGAIWLTIPQAAAVSGLSQPFLRRCVKRGELRAVRDRAVKVRRADLDNLDNVSELSRSVAGGAL